LIAPSHLHHSRCLQFTVLSDDDGIEYLYIRDSFKIIADSIMNKRSVMGHTKVLLTGTPGTGKSFFLFYLLWLLLKMKKRVLFVLESERIYYDENGNVYTIEPQRIAGISSPYSWVGLWCLFDSKDQTFSTLRDVRYAT